LHNISKICNSQYFREEKEKKDNEMEKKFFVGFKITFKQ